LCRGRRTAIQDARGNYTTFAYDDAGRLESIEDQLGQLTTYGYDAAGRQISRHDAKDQRTTYTYSLVSQGIFFIGESSGKGDGKWAQAAASRGGGSAALRSL